MLKILCGRAYEEELIASARTKDHALFVLDILSDNPFLCSRAVDMRNELETQERERSLSLRLITEFAYMNRLEEELGASKEIESIIMEVQENRRMQDQSLRSSALMRMMRFYFEEKNESDEFDEKKEESSSDDSLE